MTALRVAVSEITRELESDIGTDRSDYLERRRSRLLGHVEHARFKDADLDSLRGATDFEQIFREFK